MQASQCSTSGRAAWQSPKCTGYLSHPRRPFTPNNSHTAYLSYTHTNSDPTYRECLTARAASTFPQLRDGSCQQRRVRAHASGPGGRQQPRPGGGPQGGPGPEEEGPAMSPQEGRVVAALVSAGLSGTIAVVGAALARIDLFRQFRFDSEAATLALTLASGVMVLELLLLLPRYDILLAGQGQEGREGTQRGSSGGGGSGGGSSSSRRRGGAVGLSLRTRDVDQLLSADSVAAALVLHQACFVAAQVVRKGTGLPLFAEAGLVMARETAKELLQRGLIFTFIAAWLTDRAFEAGADDTITLLGGELYLTDAIRYATGCLITALLVPPILNEAEALRLGVASNLALVGVEARQRAEREEMEARGERPDEEADKLLREYRLVEALSSASATGPPRLAYAVTLLRGLLRFGSVNAAFALTGDLSASLAASALPNLLLMAYVRAGPMVLLERPGQGEGGQEGEEASGKGRGAEGAGRPTGEEAEVGDEKGEGRDR